MKQDENAKIQQLSTHVANKIAAGEVVERPASVVKELIENCVDAGATKIDVEITAGGRKLIAITDNGCGMSRRDALMAPERQATSKIKEVDDIEHITTLGFRGEALASIASVSRFTLKTRRSQDNAGTSIEIQGGKILEVSDCGIPAGTCIEVRDLFFNVPARRSFLRSFQTEQAHIRNIVLVHAIAYPKIMFTLKCDGDEVYRLPIAENLYDRLHELVGEEEMSRLIPLYTLKKLLLLILMEFIKIYASMVMLEHQIGLAPTVEVNLSLLMVGLQQHQQSMLQFVRLILD